MGKYQDLSGKKIGRFTVSDKTEVRKIRHRYYLCTCDCGKDKWVNARSLITGKSVSCGCYRNEQLSKKMSKPDSIKKGKLFIIYCGMRSRCYNMKSNNFHLWGGKGVSICEEWINNYEAFRDWALANGYKEGLSIDRKESDKNYEPSNCRWITQRENSSKGKMNLMRVRLVRKLYETNIFSKERLAEIYGIRVGSVRNILSKKTWATI